MFKRIAITVYLPEHFVVCGHSSDHDVIDQFDMTVLGYDPSVDNAIKMSVVDCP